MRRLFALLLLAAPAFAADPPKPDKDGFVPLFNGKDLTGWVNVNCGPKTWTVKDGVLVTSGSPIGLLRTEKQYENFEAEFEWMHVNTKETGNSGFFVWCDPLPQVGGPFTRGIEVQVLVNYPKNDWATNHGDVFSVSGAKCTPDRPHPTKKGLERCLPSEDRCKGGGEWNHYRVVAKDGAIKLSVNGKEVSGVSECTPRKGYLSFESEGAECHFRNVKIKELPTSNPKKELVADVDAGWKPLFNHTDLDGWKTDDKNDLKDWKVEGGVMKFVGKEAGIQTIESTGQRDIAEVRFDYRTKGGTIHVALGAGSYSEEYKKAGVWQRFTQKVEKSGLVDQVEFFPTDGLEVRNVYVREFPAKK